MLLTGVYPAQCEFDALTAAAVAACDSLDGLKDGVIAASGLCNFDPHALVGKKINCTDTGAERTISAEAAIVALAFWNGPRTTDGRFMWYGYNRGASLAGVANTTCDSTGKCSPVPFSISDPWIKDFVLKDPSFNLQNISYREFDTIFRQSKSQFDSIISTNDPDLRDFREAGGKMITWHGLADELIPPNGTFDYYDKVLKLDPKAEDFYRVFAAPGVDHCGRGNGYIPLDAFQSLIDWVEKDVVPETLNGTTIPGPDGTMRHEPLCPYPLVSAYKGGDVNQASSFRCEQSF
jgi:Tannase and feruloyl esterase